MVGCRRREDVAHGVRIELLAAGGGVSEAVDDERNDARHVRRGHRGTLQIRVEAAFLAVLAAHFDRGIVQGIAVGIRQSFLDRDVQRVGRQDLVRAEAVLRRPEEVAEEPARGGDLDVRVAVVGVVGLGGRRSDGRHPDHVWPLRREDLARVRDDARLRRCVEVGTAVVVPRR